MNIHKINLKIWFLIQFIMGQFRNFVLLRVYNIAKQLWLDNTMFSNPNSLDIFL